MQSAKFPIETKRLGAGEISVEIGTFRQKANSFTAGDLLAVPAENLGFASGGRNQAKNDLERCALARSVRAEQPIDLAGRDFQVQVAHGDNRSPLQRNRKNLGNANDSDSGLNHAESQNRGLGVDLQAALRTAF